MSNYTPAAAVGKFKGERMKKLSLSILLIVSLLGGLLLSACSGSAPAGGSPQTQETAIPPVQADGDLLVEGRLVPAEYVNLSFNMTGVIVEVLVEEGQQVEAGQPLARLDQREKLAAQVAAAELELVSARQALKALHENSAVITAAAQQKVAAARDAVRDAERYLNNLKSGSRSTDIEKARANVVLLKDQLTQAQKDFAQYENKPEDNLERARYQAALAEAQQRYDDAVRYLNNLEGNPSDLDLNIAEANLALAQANLALAEQEYEEVKDGPDPDDLEIAGARLKAAENSLIAAQASLADAELVAPISGTVVNLNIKAGEQAMPGVAAVTLADLSSWLVETEDLNEMELPRVEIGQVVTVTPDALPELELEGRVESISDLFVERFGEVTYTARIVLTESDPRLRWGMTVVVDFGR